MWKVNEIFHSLQGEGYNTGTACVFIRLSGCNLRCNFCDTQHEQGSMMSLPQIIEEVMRYPLAPFIVITGGEPALQVNGDFINGLKTATGKRIAIETNGTIPLPNSIDWVTCSPKGGLGGNGKLALAITRCDELKVVYVGQDLTQYNGIQATHRFLQPCWTSDIDTAKANMAATVQAVLDHPEWRLSLQTHRVLGIR